MPSGVIWGISGLARSREVQVAEGVAWDDRSDRRGNVAVLSLVVSVVIRLPREPSAAWQEPEVG